MKYIKEEKVKNCEPTETQRKAIENILKMLNSK